MAIKTRTLPVPIGKTLPPDLLFSLADMEDPLDVEIELGSNSPRSLSSLSMGSLDDFIDDTDFEPEHEGPVDESDAESVKVEIIDLE